MLSRIASIRAIARLERFSSMSTVCARSYSTSPLWKQAATTDDDDDDSKTLRKTELVRIVARDHDLMLNESKEILDTILKTITEVREKQ